MMCQRPDCAYVHPAFVNYLYKNQMKNKGKKSFGPGKSFQPPFPINGPGISPKNNE